MGEFQQLTESSNRFAFKLYQDLRSDRGNMICSPYSLGILLSMVLEGSGGKTETEIATLINHSKNNENVLKSYQSIIKSMSSPALKIATRLFVEQGMKLNPNFTALTTHYFLSDVHKEDFIKNPENSRIDINNWAEEKTNHKIKDLLPSGSITDTTCLVLVNAIHFKANWKKRFNKNNTVDMPFYVTPTQTVDVPMMIMNEGRFRYTHSTKLNAKILEMPYEGDMFSMIIFLPNEIDGLNEMENKLKSINLNEELSSLDEITVNVIVPRFKIEKTLDLNDILKEKIPSAFTNANFSGITEDPIQISKVLQKAFIEVNEEGTEAAVATAILIELTSFHESPPTPEFLCNRPFMSVIVHKPSGTYLFFARLNKIK